MTPPPTARRRTDFTTEIVAVLKESRVRQHLSQSDLAARTGGAVSRVALASYESGHRSPRMDVVWTLIRALDEDPGQVMRLAGRRSQARATGEPDGVTIDLVAARCSADEHLIPVQRWSETRSRDGDGRSHPTTVTLSHTAMLALADLMGVTVAECRRRLIPVTVAAAT